MKLLLYYLKFQKKPLIIALFLAAINQTFSLLDPWVTGNMVDDIIVPIKKLTKDEFLSKAIFWILCSIGVTMVSRIAKNFQDYFTNVVTQQLGAHIYSDGLKHALSLPYSDFEDRRSGETLNILQKVRTDTEKLIQNFVGIIFTSFVGIIFVLIYSIAVSPYVALIYLVSISLIGFISSWLSKKIKAMQQTIVKETSSLAGTTTETLRNIELIKSLGLSNQEITRLNSVNKKILGLELKKVKFIRSLNFLQGTIVQFIRSCMILLLLYLIFNNQISEGDYFKFWFYSFFIFSPIQELGNIILMQKEAQISIDNFNNLMKQEPEKLPENPLIIGELNSVNFKSVKFQHQSAKTPALQNINFDVKKGETIAFVGPSGSGKTTLVKLLVGLYRPIEGDIFYNNLGSNDINYNQFRSKIGFVTQDIQLFAGTIKENLLFVNPNANENELITALEQAKASNLLNKSEKKLETVIGEGGLKLSGGEKQRLSIARALLRHPELLVFDEATSALDSMTEEEITQTVKSLNKDKNMISILIAHRLSTIMHADRIYVLEKGSIVEQGSHQNLLEEKGLYYAMWRQQIGEKLYE